MQGRITWSGKSCLPDHVVLPDSTVSRKQGCLYAANSPDLHNLILISSVNPHIPRYIEQDAHLAKLQHQRCAAIAEKRQRRTGYRHDAGDNEQVHQRLDSQLGS